MENPWKKLTFGNNKSIVLSSDREIIQEWNEEYKKKKKHKKQKKNKSKDCLIRLNRIPCPFIGNPKAGIVILNLNPGYNTKDAKFHLRDEGYRKSAKWNLVHKEQFYLLNFKKSPGYDWWESKLQLKDLIDKKGIKKEKILSDIFCVEFFPYYSINFTQKFPKLKSQDYSFYLVRKAIKRNALIIIMKGEDVWVEKISELSGNCFVLTNAQKCSIKDGNFFKPAPEGYKRFLTILKPI